MANNSFQKLKELNLSRDEVDRIGEALKKDEFRKLLTDYIEEIQDPANKKIYEEEIIQLEKERGVDVTFINPEPGYVIKTSVDGSGKCFINICVNDNVKKPSSSNAVKDGSRGLQWSLPHSLTPPREDIDRQGARCQVYDVVFHPDAVHLAQKNKQFYHMLNKTACEAIEANFEVKLDMKNLKYPKMQYKGVPHASIIRKPVPNYSAENRDPAEQEFLDKLYAQADEGKVKKPSSPKKPSKGKSEGDKSPYATPKYVIKHRSHVDIQEFVEHKEAKLNVTIPKELIVEINLPLLKSSSDITLDVTEKTVQLISEKPSKYKLSLTLPYRVNQDNGNAKFDKDLKKLIITLPVKRNIKNLFEHSVSHDSGVESDHGSPTASMDQVFSDNCEKSAETNRTRAFLDDNTTYTLPEFTCHRFENTLAFTLNVKNVDQSSIAHLITSSSVHVKFASVSSSFYHAHYAFYIQLPSPSHHVDKDKFQVEIWDNNVVVQVPFIQCDKVKCDYYYYGLDEYELKPKYFDEPAIINSVLESTIPEETELEIPVRRSELPKLDQLDSILDDNEKKTNAINIVGTSSYESSGDELSYSYSPSKSKGILKRMSSQRFFVGRSISESDLDEVCSSVDSAMPEDPEMSTSLKKTVRFNDVIMRQLFRSNSSILGQKKKNQRKARNKKRAQERRLSESEASEVDEKKEEGGNEINASEEHEKAELEDINDIFDMDMNY